MALMEIAAEGVIVAVRVVGWLLIELFVEVFLHTTGRLLLRRRAGPEAGEGWCILVGLLFWASFVAAIWLWRSSAG